MVKSFYDSQKLRIEVGNRIAGNVRIRLGQEPGTKTEDMDEKAQSLLASLIIEYKRITDTLATSSARAKVKAIQANSGVITDVFEYNLVGYYISLLTSEGNLEKTIREAVHTFPIWKLFLEDVRGCGPLMSAVIISELDPAKAEHISGFWKYAGLDVVIKEDGAGEGRSRKQHHLVDRAYINKKGEEATRKGITFNPFLKTKLIGVLGGCFVKQGDKYREIYDGYKFRLQNRPDCQELTKGHINARAIRYAVKIFLRDLWLAWREIECLPITPDYAEAKLGLVHTKSPLLAQRTN